MVIWKGTWKETGSDAQRAGAQITFPRWILTIKADGARSQVRFPTRRPVQGQDRAGRGAPLRAGLSIISTSTAMQRIVTKPQMCQSLMLFAQEMAPL